MVFAHAHNKQVREGFIVDDEEDDDDDQDGDGSEPGARPQPKRKRDQKDREEEAQLDEEDLELIGEQLPNWDRKPAAEVGPPLPVALLFSLAPPA